MKEFEDIPAYPLVDPEARAGVEVRGRNRVSVDERVDRKRHLPMLREMARERVDPRVRVPTHKDERISRERLVQGPVHECDGQVIPSRVVLIEGRVRSDPSFQMDLDQTVWVLAMMGLEPENPQGRVD